MSSLGLLPVLTLALRESTFVLIALAQGALVFFLCHASKSRVASIAIGAVGVVVAVMVGDNRYGWLDVLFVIAATLAAVVNLTPQKEGRDRKPRQHRPGAGGGESHPAKEGRNPRRDSGFCWAGRGAGPCCFGCRLVFAERSGKARSCKPRPFVESGRVCYFAVTFAREWIRCHCCCAGSVTAGEGKTTCCGG